MTEHSTASTAEELAIIAEKLGLNPLAGEIQQQSQRRLAQGRLRVVVLGEANHGKSSLINALVGRKLVPVGVTPTTQHVVSVRAGTDCGRYRIDGREDAGRERREIEESTFIDAIRGTEELEAPLSRLEVVCEPGNLPENLELLDTPGFNDVDRLREAVSRGELPGADVLILVLDATQMLTKTELSLLARALESVGGIERSGVVLEVVINRIDLVEPKERPSLVEAIAKSLSTVLPNTVKPFLTDARRALKEPEADDDGVDGIRRLRERLLGLSSAGEDLLPARNRGSLRTNVHLLSYSANIQARALELDSEQLDREIEGVQTVLADRELDLDKLREDVESRGRELLVDFSEQTTKSRGDLERNARQQLETIEFRQLTDGFPGAIRDAFLADARKHLEALVLKLDELSRDVMATHGNRMRRRLMEASLRLEFIGSDLHITPPSLGVEAGTIALGVIGTAVMYLGRTATGLLMTIASPIATMLLRNRATREARETLDRQLGSALDTSYEELKNSAEEMVEDHGTRLLEHVRLADAKLGEQLLAILRHARESREQLDIDQEGKLRELRMIESRLECIGAEIDAAIDEQQATGQTHDRSDEEGFDPSTVSRNMVH